MKLVELIVLGEYEDKTIKFINPLYIESVCPSHKGKKTIIRMNSGDDLIVPKPLEEVIKLLESVKPPKKVVTV
jgi:uncharacterized protein YlzI (FlbEa/FlbD family)